MTQPATLLLIADIAGYTRFMKLHDVSLAHAQDVVARLLEAVIDAARPHLKLAKLEGDAAFFHAPADPDQSRASGSLSGIVARIHRAFHERVADLAANALCPCDGCKQAGNLKIKLVGHVGTVAMQKVKRMTELAGVDVIVVHRLLKNQVPIDEYLLVTRPALDLLDPAARERAATLAIDLAELGPAETFYIDLGGSVEDVPAAKLSILARLSRHLRLTYRSIPYFIGVRKACTDFRNVAP